MLINLEFETSLIAIFFFFFKFSFFKIIGPNFSAISKKEFC